MTKKTFIISIVILLLLFAAAEAAFLITFKSAAPEAGTFLAVGNILLALPLSSAFRTIKKKYDLKK
ncbi:MAG: hypothetical protein LBP62_02135 [Clostridiales bacterium]|jgi:hypothetical protein|nr:hypothetical protein [Clostridiales bacterium]